jgi:predicted nucleic acid-binding protein
MFCFDTDVLSAVVGKAPSLPLIRRLARTPPEQQFTTAITLGELLCGAARRGSSNLERQVREVIVGALTVLPFDAAAAEVYGTAWRVKAGAWTSRTFASRRSPSPRVSPSSPAMCATSVASRT